MKRFIVAWGLLLAVVLPCAAQFEGGKVYLSGSLDGFGISYSDATKFNIGLGVNAGYMVADDWLVLGDVGVDAYRRYADVSVGIAGRFFFEQNGIYLQAGAKYQYRKGSCGSVALCPEVGYCHFLNEHLTLEPAIYADFSLNDFSSHTTFGLKIGVGWYF